jgi:acyl-CoA reductase-like NAD-dependent aldehyde dehydrogenase/nicotinamidase-related amidase
VRERHGGSWPGRAALLLLDLQGDFLDRPGLLPPRPALTERAAALLAGCRELGIPVVHVHTRVRADGDDRMPHWREQGLWACVEATEGILPPGELQPSANEAVFFKRFYGGFEASGLGPHLDAHGVETLLLAGLYLHACVRATALDAYARGHDVWIVEDAVGSTEPVHAEITRDYLARRAATFATVEEVLEKLGGKPRLAAAQAARAPVACIDGVWRDATPDAPCLQHRRPARTAELIAEVPVAESEEVAEATAAAVRAQRAAHSRRVEERVAWLRAWAAQLAARESELVALMVREIGKPRAEARAELRRALAHVETAARLVEDADASTGLAPGVRVRYRPVGVVGLVTPWNNPVAIPVGKLAPALGFGNAAVWKPAYQASHCARAVLESLRRAGVPDGTVNLVFGDARTARLLIATPGIAAVALTGSTATGRSAAALCTLHGKPLQAELGGNNAAVVLRDADVAAAAPALAAAAFGFAGQRCTATRRLVVEREIRDAFLEAFLAAVADLRVGDPEDELTQVGPLVSTAHRSRVVAALELALAEGGRVVCGGVPPPGLEEGCYYAPTVVSDLAPDAHLVREETFGPVAVVQTAEDLESALALVNGVDQGLVASIHTRDPARRARFADAAEAGILQLASGALAVAADAPFGGWKASGIGPPEHGIWDREFYARPQAVYGEGPEGAG